MNEVRLLKNIIYNINIFRERSLQLFKLSIYAIGQINSIYARLLKDNRYDTRLGVYARISCADSSWTEMNLSHVLYSYWTVWIRLNYSLAHLRLHFYSTGHRYDRTFCANIQKSARGVHVGLVNCFGNFVKCYIECAELVRINGYLHLPCGAANGDYLCYAGN